MTADPVRRRIVIWAGVSGALLAVSLLLPGAFARGPGEVGAAPFAAFGIPFVGAAIAAVYVAFITFDRMRSLPVALSAAGLLPSVLVAAVAALVLGG